MNLSIKYKIVPEISNKIKKPRLGVAIIKLINAIKIADI